MWTRKELKDKGKASFRQNYWKSVLVALVLTIAMACGYGVTVNGGGPTSIGTSDNTGITAYEDGTAVDISSGDLDSTLPGEIASELEGDGVRISVNNGIEGGKPGVYVDAQDSDTGESVHLDINQDTIAGMPWGVMAALISLTLLITFALTIVIYAFALNPLQAGCRGFFTANLNRPAEVREAVSTFDHGYMNVVKAMILRDVFTFLWTLLFIIPGIIKAYEYRMIPYLVAENPEMTYKEAFAESRRMMRGNKWRTFVLDLSFLGWWILSAFTLGILAVFYVGPYHAATSAALYERLRYGGELPPFAAGAHAAPTHAAQVVTTV